MFKSPWRMFLVLASVVLVALFSGFFLRDVLIKDFQHALESERRDLVRPVTSDIEGSYAKYKRWNQEDLAGDAVYALMLGLQVQIKDARSEVVMDTDKALALLPLERKALILGAVDFNGQDKKSSDYHSYPLMRGDERVGSLDVKFLKTGKEALFINRSGKVVLVWSFVIAGLALALGVFISRKPGGSIGQPVQTTASDRSADRKERMPVPEKGETTGLLEARGQETEKRVKSPDGPALTTAAAKEEEAEALLDDLQDARDEDMQPRPGDADRLTTIVRGLDQLARAQALGRALQKQPVELASYLHNIIENTRGAVQDKDIAFNLECEDNLRLSIDPACLEGIMSNLLDNAAKAVKKEGTVTVSAAAQGDHVVIAVRDTGSGISRKALPHIYERFYRGSGNGIGLGLTIVQELVRACEATIEVETTRGKGSVFTVSIPSLQQELF